MESSAKYHEARIIDAFESTLEYTPSPEQIRNHMGWVSDGSRTLDEVELFLLYNPTYYNHVGGTDTAYITALYQHILHRAPTESQLAYWMPRLQANRVDMVKSLWDNPASVRTRIADAYHHYLDTEPSAEQVEDWRTRLAESAGRSEAALRRGLITSPEYFERANARF